MSALGQRLVPIRPSPLRGHNLNTGQDSFTNLSLATLTPPHTGIKRKFEEYEDDDLDYDSETCKRKINFVSEYGAMSPPHSISRRNARERNRVKQVNNGFAALRQHIPSASQAKKISKVDTLKQAVEYIQNLTRLLEENDKAFIRQSNGGMMNQRQPSAGYQMETNSFQDDYSSSHELQSPASSEMSSNYFFSDNSFTDLKEAFSNVQNTGCSIPQDQDRNQTNNTYFKSDIGDQNTPPHLARTPSNSISPTSPHDHAFNSPQVSSSVYCDISRNSKVTPIYSNVRGILNDNSQNIPMDSTNSEQQMSCPSPLYNHQTFPRESLNGLNYNTNQRCNNIQTLDSLSPLNPNSAPFESKLPLESAHKFNPDTPRARSEYRSVKVKQESPYEAMHVHDSSDVADDCSASEMTNIDSVLTSNLSSTLATLIDGLDPTTTLPDGSANLLDALDFWEKC